MGSMTDFFAGLIVGVLFSIAFVGISIYWILNCPSEDEE